MATDPSPDSAPEPRVDADAELVERCRAGDRAAFDAIVHRYEEPVQRLVRRYVKIEADAQDVSQRVFLRVFEKIGTFRGESSFRTWLFRVAVHAALNHVRGQPRTEPAELDDLPSFTSSLETGKLVAAELWQKVQARLLELPPKQRLVAELRLFHELSFKEIAALADCSEDAAKANFHHAVKRLREGIDTEI